MFSISFNFLPIILMSQDDVSLLTLNFWLLSPNILAIVKWKLNKKCYNKEIVFLVASMVPPRSTTAPVTTPMRGRWSLSSSNT